ncbi:MAG: hypothetical protein RLZZ242_926, partial [Bacteroidota bacterium]
LRNTEKGVRVDEYLDFYTLFS